MSSNNEKNATEMYQKIKEVKNLRIKLNDEENEEFLSPFVKRIEFVRIVDKMDNYFIVTAFTQQKTINVIEKDVTKIETSEIHSIEFPLGEQPAYMNEWSKKEVIEITRQEFDHLKGLYYDDKNAFIHFQKEKE